MLPLTKIVNQHSLLIFNLAVTKVREVNKETEWDKLITTGIAGLPKADIIFIDAGHSYEEVKNDVKQYQSLVSPGGLLILHDTIQLKGPRRVVSEMFDKGLKFCSLTTSCGCGLTIIRC